MLSSPGSTAARPDAGVPAWHARRVLADWSTVRVHPVDLQPSRDGVRVRAVVRLGALAPADVHVELRPAARTDEARARSRAMWSVQAYDNGCYVFEATLAHQDLAADVAWMVRVRPRAPLPAPDVLLRLRLHAPHVIPS